MERLDKAERLRERANVSYEEAKAALEQANDDLLDAMLILEKQGKVKQPGQSTYSTSYEDQTQYVKVQEKVEEQKKQAPGRNIGRLVRRGIHFVTHTSFYITFKEKTVFALPSWLAALIILFSWKLSVPALLIALLFGVRYRFEGDDNIKEANEFLSKAGSFADGVQSELKKGNSGREGTRQEETKQEGTRQEETRQEGTGQEGTGQEETQKVNPAEI